MKAANTSKETQDATSQFDRFRREIDGAARRFALRWTRHHDEAEDALQEAYVRAFRAFDRVADARDRSAWFCQIVKRVLLDRSRSQKRRPVCVSLDCALEDNPHLEPLDPAANPELSLMSQVIDPDYVATLERLDPRHVETLQMCLDTENKLPVCRMRLHRARRAFIAALRETQARARMHARKEATA